MHSTIQQSYDLLRYLLIIICSLSTQQLFAITEAEVDARFAEAYEKTKADYVELIGGNYQDYSRVYFKAVTEVSRSMPFFSVIKYTLGLKVSNDEWMSEKFKEDIKIQNKELNRKILPIAKALEEKINVISQEVIDSDLSFKTKTKILSNFSPEKITPKLNSGMNQALVDHDLALGAMGFNRIVDRAKTDLLSHRKRALTHKIIPGLLLGSGMTACLAYSWWTSDCLYCY